MTGCWSGLWTAFAEAKKQLKERLSRSFLSTNAQRGEGKSRPRKNTERSTHMTRAQSCAPPTRLQRTSTQHRSQPRQNGVRIVKMFEREGVDSKKYVGQ